MEQKDKLNSCLVDCHKIQSVSRKDNSESGRSMVEMLGVLAIIGVLSVGGVAGYNFAMTRYRANEIIESVKQRATVGSGQYLQGMEAINLSEFPNTILEYETDWFNEGLNGEKDLFSIDVKEVPQAVCQDILDRNWTWPAGIFVNERAIPCPEGNSKMTFVFAADLNERIDAEAYDPCWGKTCCRTTDPNTLAFEEGQNLSNKECQKTAANNLTCCTTANTRQCYFDQASIDRYGPHQNTIADCTNDGLHRCDGDLNCVCTTGCTNPDKVQNPNTCACTCPTGVPNADDSACVECLADTDCTGGKVCNMADNTCACPESGSVPQNTCYTTTAHAATEACPAYTTYEPLTCTEPKTVCDVANNTCKCPACPATGMTQNPDTCECTCPGGKVFNSITRKCVECVNDTNCAGRTDNKFKCDTTKNVCKAPCQFFGLKDGLKYTSVWGNKCNRTFVAYTSITTPTSPMGSTHSSKKSCTSIQKGYLIYLSDESFNNVTLARHTYNNRGSAILSGKDMFQPQDYSFTAGEKYQIVMKDGKAHHVASEIEIDLSPIGSPFLCHE